jgi:hypothetical protein
MSPTGTGHVTIKPTAVGDMDNMIIGATTPLAGGFTTVKAATTIGVGAATPSASGAGITFPATQSASTDANTLDDYEEGTWTPNQGSGLTVVGAFSSDGTYTKIGRLVTVTGNVSGATTVAIGGTQIISTNLPFANQGLLCVGSISDTGAKVGHTFTNPTTSLLYGTTMTASAALYFTLTYTTS